MIGSRCSAAERLAQGFAEEGEVELIDAFSSRLPVMVIIDMLGLPQEDHDLFHEWYPAMMAGLTGTPEQRTYGIECNEQFHAYIDRLVDERSVNPGEDLISKLCIAEVDGARMSKEDIKAFSSLLLVAGGETTDKAIGNMWVHMMENPDQFAEVKRDPDLFDRVFTETMRITPPAGSQSRDVVKPVELYGQTIPVGDEAHFSIFGANHDERVFDHPDEFDIFRDDLYFGRELRSGYFEGGRAGHLGFGLGKHFCVGYQLARSEAVIGSKALLQAMGNPRVKPGGAAHIQVAGPMNEQPRSWSSSSTWCEGRFPLARVGVEAAAFALGAHTDGVGLEARAALLVGEGAGDILPGLGAVERDPLLGCGLDDDAQGRIEALDEVVLGGLVVGVGLVREGSIEPVLRLLVLANDGAALGGGGAAGGVRDSVAEMPLTATETRPSRRMAATRWRWAAQVIQNLPSFQTKEW